jgi:site-specific DNA-methyltransferase (adenine-specific)
MIDKALYSSASVEWETPQKLYAELDREFHFDLDPCCTKKNQKCPSGFCADLNQDGLGEPWFGNVFMNPPYGRGIIEKWVGKARDEVEAGRAKVVVGLIHSRTDTIWFHKYVYKKTEIRFIKGRLKFGGSKHGAPFPSMIAIWRKA